MTSTFDTAQDDLRPRLAAVLEALAPTLITDTAEILSLVGGEQLGRDDPARLADLLLHLLARTVRDGRVDPRSDLISQLQRLSGARSLAVDTLFSFAYTVERTALNELAIHPALGATNEPWPLVAQIVRRASFELLAAIAERRSLEPGTQSLVDPITSLFSRPLFETVLVKELDRAGRVGESISLLLFEVDRLSALNAELGTGVGDKLLERVGILIRGFFRVSDWVARYDDDCFAVLLAGSDPKDAKALAERVRKTVEDRLEIVDHRTNQPVSTTVSASVVSRDVAPGEFIDPERLIAEAEAGLRRLTPG